MTFLVVVGAVIAFLVAVAIHDVVQRRHSILRNYPVIGHLRFLLEKVGPELRQYIVTDNNEELPFTRDQRRWVYATAKKQDNYFGFGSDNDFTNSGYPFIKHAPFPHGGGIPTGAPLPCAKVIGEWRSREHAFRPASLVNVSAMSFGSLSSAAITALNKGAALAGCLHNTGEGGMSDYHLNGGDLVYQIGTGYFGCRDQDGQFSLDGLLTTLGRGPVRMLEIKLSQGAKPGLGGVLPAAKVTSEIAEIRGVPIGQDVISPAGHTAFHDVASLVEFIEMLGDATGVPVGIKSAVGRSQFWDDLANHMAATGRGPDFVTVDGGEGGTGAAPLAFADHVALPWRDGFPRVYSAFARVGLQENVVFIGSGKLGLPANALLAMALGVDMVNVAREAMMSIGCIQALRCHTGHCPTGVATQSKWLVRGLDPEDKSVRMGNYIIGLRGELLKLSHACGVSHPALLPPDTVELVYGDRLETIEQRYSYEPDWRARSPRFVTDLEHLMAA